MNGNWNPSNNLKKTCSDFTLVVGVKREMGLGIFRNFELVLLCRGSFWVLISAYIVKRIF